MGIFTRVNGRKTTEEPAPDKSAIILKALESLELRLLDAQATRPNTEDATAKRLMELETGLRAVQLDVQNMFEKTNSALQRMNKRWRDILEREDSWDEEPEDAVAPPPPAPVTRADLNQRWAAMKRSAG